MQRSKHLRALRDAAQALRADRRGITALEYGIIAGWLAFVVVVAFTNLAGDLSGIFLNVSSKI